MTEETAIELEELVNRANEEGSTEESSILSPEEQALLDSVLEEVHSETPTNSEIPINSGSLSLDEYTVRFSSASWYDKIKQQKVILAGLGGIGSWTNLLLARMSIKNLYIYDPDIVESANLSGQLYRTHDVGELKVNASASIVKEYSGYTSVYAIPQKFDENCMASDIMICGFDNMKSRKVFFESWLKHVNSKSEEDKKKCLFLDGRLNAEELQILCIKGDDNYNIDLYKTKYLFSDAEADETICSYKQTTFMANMIGSLIVNLFVNFIANQLSPIIERDLPFYTEYSAETMFFKTIS